MDCYRKDGILGQATNTNITTDRYGTGLDAETFPARLPPLDHVSIGGGLQVRGGRCVVDQGERKKTAEE